MRTARKPWLRGVVTLGLVGAVAASLLISPAGAHITTFGHLKKHIKKIANQRIKALVPGMISAADNVRETRRFTLADGGSQVILQHGPFTVTAGCDLDAAGQDIATLLIATSQDNSSFDASDELDDFDTTTPADERDWGSQINVAADTLEVEDQTGVAIAPDGTTLILAGAMTAVNLPSAPNTCGFAAVHILA
jgi:hypothetical protein